MLGIAVVWLSSVGFRCYLAAHAPYYYNEMNTFNHLISVAYGGALAVVLRGAPPPNTLDAIRQPDRGLFADLLRHIFRSAGSEVGTPHRRLALSFVS